MSTLADGFRLSVGTFTRIPSGEVTISPTTARAALLLSPVAVVPLALAAGLVAASTAIGVPPLVAAALALGVLAHGSRGMHLDGLADTVDGLGAGWDRARALRVMRSGDLGPMGAAALVLVLLVQAGSVAHLLERDGARAAVLLATVVIASRSVAALVCSGGVGPAEGSRLGAAFVGSVPPFAAVLLVAIAALLTTGGALAGGSVAPILAACAVVLAAVAASALRRHVTAVLGGINGDTIGAAIELSLTVILVCLGIAW